MLVVLVGYSSTLTLQAIVMIQYFPGLGVSCKSLKTVLPLPEMCAEFLLQCTAGLWDGVLFLGR